MVPVVAGLYGFHLCPAEIVGFVLPVHQGVAVPDDPAAIVPVLDQLNLVVVHMFMRNQDQVCREVIAFSGVRVDIDHLFVLSHDPEAPMPLIKETGCMDRIPCGPVRQLYCRIYKQHRYGKRQ